MPSYIPTDLPNLSNLSASFCFGSARHSPSLSSLYILSLESASSQDEKILVWSIEYLRACISEDAVSADLTAMSGVEGVEGLSLVPASEYLAIILCRPKLSTMGHAGCA